MESRLTSQCIATCCPICCDSYDSANKKKIVISHADINHECCSACFKKSGMKCPYCENAMYGQTEISMGSVKNKPAPINYKLKLTEHDKKFEGKFNSGDSWSYLLSSLNLALSEGYDIIVGKKIVSRTYFSKTICDFLNQENILVEENTELEIIISKVGIGGKAQITQYVIVKLKMLAFFQYQT